MTRAWMAEAACRRDEVDPEVFFPVQRSGPMDVRRWRAALAWCAICPVAAECLAYAAAQPGVQGVWGGRLFTGRRHRTQVAS